MRAIVRLCFGVGLSIALIAPASAELAMTGAPVVMRAGASGNASVVQALLAKGADVNAKAVGGLGARNGLTALGAATSKGNGLGKGTAQQYAEIRALLVQAGAKR